MRLSSSTLFRLWDKHFAYVNHARVHSWNQPVLSIEGIVYWFELFYLVTLSVSWLQIFINFRTSTNYPSIERFETGSYLRLERNDRKCSKCDLNELRDQFCYLFRCKHCNADRRKNAVIASVRYPDTLNQLHMCEIKSKKLVYLSTLC